MIAIVDYDIGNIAAVANMLHRVGALSEITSSPERLECADRIILPGNGAFDACMRNLRRTGLIPVLERRVLGDRVPILGICVGAQMLGRGSAEGSEPGLGWLDMQARRFPESHEFPVPHMGWSDVTSQVPAHPILRGMDPEPRFYFVHSYYLDPMRSEDVLLSAEYGITFAAGVARENIVGVQFHPEKSHRFGKRLLAAFAGVA